MTRTKNSAATLGLYDQLREEIVSGQLHENSPLVESALAVRYGTSRTPVREALSRLEQDGLVVRGDRGLEVRSRSPEEILEIYEVRVELESMAAALAAQRHTALDLRRIDKCATAMASLDSFDAEERVRTNRQFHAAVWNAGHNSTLVDLLERINNHLTRYPSTTLTNPERWKVVNHDHRQLVRLIAARDAEGARKVAREHMASARDLRLELYAGEGIS